MPRPRRRLAGLLLLAVALAAAAALGAVPRGASRGAVASSGPLPLSASRHRTPSAFAPQALPPSPAGSTTSMHAITVDGRERQWSLVSPNGPLSGAAPILVVLHGINAPVDGEEQRDGLLPLAAHGQAQLVYPVGIGESWNAGGCCGEAWRQGIDDVHFLQVLVAAVDSRRLHPVYLVGYSNGGRMAYTVACADPGLVDGYAVVNAMPLHPCAAALPVTILQVAGTADAKVPYRPGDPGSESPPATTQAAALRATAGCSSAGTTATAGTMTLSEWSSCAGGVRVGFATYTGGTHAWPVGDASTPGAAQVIWQFLGGAAWP